MLLNILTHLLIQIITKYQTEIQFSFLIEVVCKISNVNDFPNLLKIKYVYNMYIDRFW